MIEPYVYVRTITVGMGTLWAIGGYVRMRRFYKRWRKRLVPLGFSASWLRLQVRTFVLRTTVLDPINLFLILTLVAIWGFRTLVYYASR